ncbi:MAG: hypothetical protein NTV80_07470 [Verrucomicrobia bacterium]|nr:hypothetical protein [Verrucomicrobiota bacterium]
MNPLQHFIRRDLLRTAYACLMAFVVLAHHVIADDKPAEALAGQRVLYTGHSFHIPLIPFIEQVAKAAQIDGHQTVAKQMIGGSRVMQHWELPDEKNIAKTTLRAGGVNVLTMSPNWVVPDEAIEKFVSLGLEKNPALRALVQVSWYPWDGLAAPAKVARNEDRDAKTVADLRAVYDPYRETIRTQLRAINAKHGKPIAYLVPVGEAVLRLREQVIAGKVPGIAKQSDLFRDQIGHGKATIHQLAAYCQFACIYRRSPVGLACFEDKTPASKELNHLLQTIAWQSVLDEPLSGVAANSTPLKQP